jgi:bifunctional oligoribonuclease and PAP phosphatase NrnA
VDKSNDKMLQLIQGASHILLNCHTGTDGDSVGSTLAMHLYLKSLGKRVTHISGDSDIPEYLKKLPHTDLIENKNWFDLDLKQFDLFIALDTGGLNQISKLSEVTIPNHLKTIVIDHHASNVGFGTIDYIEKDSISACQTLFWLFKKWGVEITKDMASLLFAGMYTDSGGFKYPLTSAKTFEAAAELVAINPEYSKPIFEMENTRLPEDIAFQALALNNIEHYFDDKVAVSIVTSQQIKKAGLAEKVPSGGEIANLLKSVIGWEIGIYMIEKKPGTFSLSFRTRNADIYDLTKVTGLLGGGGHKAAAGAQIQKPLEEARKVLLEALENTYPNLGKP